VLSIFAAITRLDDTAPPVSALTAGGGGGAGVSVVVVVGVAEVVLAVVLVLVVVAETVVLDDTGGASSEPQAATPSSRISAKDAAHPRCRLRRMLTTSTNEAPGSTRVPPYVSPANGPSNPDGVVTGLCPAAGNQEI
jgi:hypothetical protein